MKEHNTSSLDNAIDEVERINGQVKTLADDIGAFICMARHPDAGTIFWLGSGAIKFEASEKALAKCKRWALRKEKDQDLCNLQHCDGPI